jgi:glyoxylase-like metal-dependent hydrolase (beta-lactamase superfamily II)
MLRQVAEGVLIPFLDLNAVDPIEDYLAALRLLEGMADDVDVLAPGHGSIGGVGQVRARIEQDRAYVHALRTPVFPATRGSAYRPRSARIDLGSTNLVTTQRCFPILRSRTNPSFS